MPFKTSFKNTLSTKPYERKYQEESRKSKGGLLAFEATKTSNSLRAKVGKSTPHSSKVKE